MTVRSAMRHRAHVVRSVLPDPFDTFNEPIPDDENVYGGDPLDLSWGRLELTWEMNELDWGTSGDTLLPCYVQSRMERTVSAEGRFFAVASYYMLAPKDADLLEEDRLTSVTDRRGVAVFDDNLRITALVRRESHLEAVLESYAG